METRIELFVRESCLGDNYLDHGLDNNRIDVDNILYFPKFRNLVFKTMKPLSLFGFSEEIGEVGVYEYDFSSNSLEKIEIESAESCILSKISEKRFLLIPKICNAEVNVRISSLLRPRSTELVVIEKTSPYISGNFCSVVKVREGILLCGMQSAKLFKLSISEKKIYFLEKFCIFKQHESKIVPSKRYENSVFINSFGNFSYSERNRSEYDTFVSLIDFKKDELIKEVFFTEGVIDDPMRDMTTFLNKNGEEILIIIMCQCSHLRFIDVETNTFIKGIKKEFSHSFVSFLHCSDENGYLFVGGSRYLDVIDLFNEYEEYHLTCLTEKDSIIALFPIVSEKSSIFEFMFISNGPGEENGKLRTFHIEGLRSKEMDRMEKKDLKGRISFLLNESVILRLKIQLENLSMDDLPRIFFLYPRDII